MTCSCQVQRRYEVPDTLLWTFGHAIQLENLSSNDENSGET